MSTWGEVLQQAGYPQTAIIIEFETFYEKGYTLKEMSTVEYICDPRFEVLGLGVQILGQDVQFWQSHDVEDCLWAYIDFEQDTIVCQNSKFDCLILQERYGITPRYTIDLIDLDRIWDARAKHSLETMAKRWNAPNLKGDIKQFKGLRWVDMTPEMRQDLEEYCKNDVEIESFLLQKLLPLIPNPQIELPLATQTLQLFLKPQIQIDAELGKELKQKMGEERLSALDSLRRIGIETTETEISGNISFVKLLNQYADVPMKPGKKKMIPALAKDDEGLKVLLEHPKEEVRLLAKARQAIRSWPLHIARVDNLMNQAKARNGLIGSPLSFYAAHTGRWGGTEGINLQNMGGRGRGGLGTHPLIQQTRTMLTAPDGYTFGIVDYAQIEARILAWLAGQDDLVEGFANNEDIYSEFATTLFGSKVRKKRDSDPKPVQKIMTIRRGFGKDAILGCGYGMGSNKFFERCRTNSDLRPMIDSGQYDWDFINKLIKTYRSKYNKIPAFWQSVEKAWRFVTKYTGQISVLEANRLTFYNKDDATFIVLPSSRYLRYPNARVKRDNTLAYRWGQLWGGSLTENIVQAVARDIMGEALLRLEQAGLKIVLHVHDEIVCMFNKETAESNLNNMSHHMSIVPTWATGLPVAVEGELSERYKK